MLKKLLNKLSPSHSMFDTKKTGIIFSPMFLENKTMSSFDFITSGTLFIFNFAIINFNSRKRSFLFSGEIKSIFVKRVMIGSFMFAAKIKLIKKYLQKFNKSSVASVIPSTEEMTMR